MQTEARSKGMWVHRLAIRLFTVALGVLFYWLLRFVVQDIQTMPGPDFASFESGHVRPELREKLHYLLKHLTELTRQIVNQKEPRRIVGDSSQNLQQTMAQLLELQKLGMQKSLPLSETEQANFATALNLFLENQRKYQDSSQAEADLVGRKQALIQEQQQIAQELSRQLEPARMEFNQATAQHRLKLAFLQLAMLLPILGIAVVAIVRKRSSLYFPLFLAFGVATLVKVTLVMHEYFPTRYFKYILIVALLIAVAGLLVYFLRSIAFPKATWLAKQYREAYERFLCPVCEYPIRTGPRRFLFWTRRSITKLPVACDPTAQEEQYVCPACGSQLFAECPACHKVRHSLLPHCAHCGAS